MPTHKAFHLSLAILALSSFAHAQALTEKDNLFAGTEKFAQNASSVTQIDMDPTTTGMVGGKDAERAHNTLLSVVHEYSYDKPGQYNMADVDVFRKKLTTGDWKCSVHTFESKSGNSTDVCSRTRTDGFLESAVVTVSPKSLTFIHNIHRPKAENR